MTGPETLYADIMSGDPATLSTLDAAAETAGSNLTDSIDEIVLAAFGLDWTSLMGRTSFNQRAWATKACAEMGRYRIYRVELVLRSVRQSYVVTRANADAVIDWWRARKATAPDLLDLQLSRDIALTRLLNIRKEYSLALANAREYLDADELTEAQEDWLLNGLSRGMLDDLRSSTDIGTVIPFTLATGSDEGYIPQGLAYGSGVLVQASYLKDGDSGVSVSIVDPGTGRQVNTVVLDKEAGFPSHAGGVAINGDDVWITTGGKAHHYSLEALQTAPLGSQVTPVGPARDVEAGSYATMYDGFLYTGSFERNLLYKHRWDGNEWVAVGQPIQAPDGAQGVVVRADEIIFSTGYGRTIGGHLKSYDRSALESGADPRDDEVQLGSVEVPNMVEGIVDLPGGIGATYESGSAYYSHVNPLESIGSFDLPFGDRNKPILGTDDARNLWASPFMTVTPFNALGLDAGGSETELSPATLREASQKFATAEAGIERSGREIDGLRLPASALGKVPGATGLAHLVNTYLDTTADFLDEGKISAGITVDGLVQTARDYEETDGGIENTLLNLLDRVQQGRHEVDETVGEVRERVGDTVDAAQEKAGDTIEAAQETASDTVDAVTEKANDAADAAKDGLKKAGDLVEGFLP